MLGYGNLVVQAYMELGENNRIVVIVGTQVGRLIVQTLRGSGLMTVIWCPLAARAFMMAWNGN